MEISYFIIIISHKTITLRMILINTAVIFFLLTNKFKLSKYPYT